MPKGSSHRVVMLVGDGSNPFEMGVATELFGLRRPELQRQWYDFALAAPGGQARMHLGFFTLADVAGLETVDTADTVIVPNRPDPHTPADPEILAAIRRADARGARLMSFCTGAFTLAEAGVLDDRRATTHWQWAEAFTARYPRVHLEPDVLFVEDGTILTAAGSAAALDLSLYVIQCDHGAEIANAVSRRLVFTGHREGGQRQFVERPVPEIPDASLAPVLEWARQHLDQPLAVTDLAARASTSAATLHRRFRAELGTTPLAWLTAERVTLARRLIERGESGLDRIAARTGLGTGANLRLQLRRHTGLSPSEYRKRFGPAAGSAPPSTVDPTNGLPHSA